MILEVCLWSHWVVSRPLMKEERVKAKKQSLVEQKLSSLCDMIDSHSVALQLTIADKRNLIIYDLVQ